MLITGCSERNDPRASRPLPGVSLRYGSVADQRRHDSAMVVSRTAGRCWRAPKPCSFVML